ncbi:MAG TPA: hypothetical protein VIM29_08670 [Bacillota bacterium]
MIHNILWLTKLALGLLLLALTFWGLPPAVVLGRSLDIYGNLYFEMADRDYTETFRAANPDLASDLWTYTSGDLFLRGSEDDSLLQFLIDYKYEGDFQGSNSPGGYFNQYYIIVPFNNNSFLYCGQKYKRVGVAKIFNIGNRYERGGYPTKLIEYDILKSDNINYGFIANFKDRSQWDQVQYSGFIDFSKNNFNMQGYCFIEGKRGYSLVADLSYQAGIFQFYGEALYMSESDQKVAKLGLEPTDDSLDYRNEDSTTKFLTGVMLNQKNYSITLEYLRNETAYNDRERNEFITYLKRHQLTGRRNLYSEYYSYNWTSNYLGLSFFLPRLGSDQCSLTASYITSLPDGGWDDEHASSQVCFNVAYNIYQNLTATFNLTHNFGGEKGEFLNLYEDKTRYQLSLLFSF